MATSTLIQRLESTAFQSSTTVPGSYTAVETPGVSNRRQVETFIAAEVITAAKLLSFDLSQTLDSDKTLFVVPADLSGADTLGVVGVALNSAAVGEKVECLLCGITNVAADAGIAAGDALSVSATGAGATAGFVVKRAAGDLYTCVGVALEATGATVAGQVKALIYKVF
jgi:hypothetical protein